MTRVMPMQQPGRSDQVVCTPKELLDAVRQRFHITEFEWDLAASRENSVAGMAFFSEEDDALTKHWSTADGWNWCNPPYANLRPWVTKAWEEAGKGAHTIMLVPASTGSNWWRDWVVGKAYITFLNGRVTFKGHTKPYPKDLALLIYAPFVEGGSTTWSWKETQ